MKKIILGLLLVLLFVIPAQASQYFGVFGTATEVDDTCRICFPTFDTLGHSADATGDSVYFLRFVRGTLVDSTYGGTKLRNYFYCTTKGAYDGTNLGQYTVVFYWRPVRDKWYNDHGYYIVEPETVSYARGDTIQRSASVFDNTSDQVIVGTNNDKTGYSLTQSFPTNFVDLAITQSTGLVDVNDKTGYKLAADGLGTDSTFLNLEKVVGSIALFVGADSNYYQILFPNDGSANKDSIRIFTPGDTHVATIIFKHNNTDAVIDSVYYYKY